MDENNKKSLLQRVGANMSSLFHFGFGDINFENDILETKPPILGSQKATIVNKVKYSDDYDKLFQEDLLHMKELREKQEC